MLDKISEKREIRLQRIRQAEAEDHGARMFRTSLGEIRKYFEDPGIIEISLNPDGKLWIETIESDPKFTGEIIAPEKGQQIIEIVATYCKTVANKDNPIISAELPFFGSRFEGILPPITEQPVFSIRQPATKLYELDDYVNKGIMTEAQAILIKSAVVEKKNILFVGGTGSGKTTATNAVLNEIAKTNDRLLILEDTLELQCTAENAVFLRTNDTVDMTRALRSCMRLRPDRIIVGEVRDKAALALLKAWNTGHPGGVATVHANSAKDGLLRIEALVGEASAVNQERLIAEAIDVVVYIRRDRERGRKVQEVAICKGFKNGDYELEYVDSSNA